MKQIIWGFWGCGKSAVADGIRIVDADCELFKYTGVNAEDLHSSFHDAQQIHRNSDYPENYVAFVQQCDADIVLVNCEYPVLQRFDSVCLYYPSLSRKEEFIHRYIQRGDNPSFVEFMEEEYEGILKSLSFTPYPRYIATQANTYLSDLVKQGGEMNMSGFITKKEIVKLIDDAKRLSVEEVRSLENIDSEEIARKLFEGELDMDIEQLQKDTREAQIIYEDTYCGTYVYEDEKKFQAIQVVRGFGNQKDEIWVRERKGREDEASAYYGFRIFNKDGILLENMEKFQSMLNNGFHKTNEKYEVGTIEKKDLDGFTHEEAVAIVMDAIAMGVIKVSHGEIYPYSYGFEFSYHNQTFKPDVNPFNMPNKIVRNIEFDKKGYKFYGSIIDSYNEISIKQLKKEVEDKQIEFEQKRIIPYKTTKEYADHKRNRYIRGLIANYSHIEEGYAVDGIIHGECHGDYSSITTNSQNEWMQAAAALRGYCLDYVAEAAQGKEYLPYLDKIVDYHKSRGLDLRDKDEVAKWVAEHPEQCYFEENRMQEKNIVSEKEVDSLEEEELEM